MVKKEGETRVNMIRDLVKQVKLEGAIPVEWELSTITNRYKGKAILQKEETVGD